MTPEHRVDILFLSQYFHPEQFLNSHLARELVNRGHRVQVVCCVPNYPVGRFFEGYSNRHRRDECWHGVSIHRAFTIPRGKTAFQLLMNYLAYPVTASWEILRLGRKRGEVSFVSMPSPLFQAIAGIFAKTFWNIPTVYWVQDIWPDSAIITLRLRNRVIVRLLSAICGWIYRRGDLIMVQSDGFRSRIAAFGVDPKRIVTLPNTAATMFRPLPPEDIPAHIRALIPVGGRIVMFAGNIGQSQDFDTVIAAAKMLPPDCELIIVVIGSGRDEARVRAVIEEQGLSDRFLLLGRHPEDTMPAFFACADAMLVTLRDEQIFELTVPSKVQAYMACAKPIVASLAGEGAAIIEDAEAGLTVEPSRPHELCRALMAIASMPDSSLHAMGTRARSAYENRFSLQAVADKLVENLQEAVRRRSTSPGASSDG